MKKAHVIGIGLSGAAAARLLHRQGWRVTLSDRGDGPAQRDRQAALSQVGIAVQLGHDFVPTLEMDLIVVSPGVPWDAPALVTARQQGIETIGEMELAWRSLSERPWLGITGTNGKTTTTALLAAIFAAAGLNAPACGNIGHAACAVALAETPPDWVIAELSSYQIEATSTLHPTIGIWTTFTPDHLNRHKTVENYYRIKASLLARSEIAVFNGDDPCLRQHAAEYGPQSHWTSVGGQKAIEPLTPSTYIEDGWVIYRGDRIVSTQSLRMVGDHNQQNLLMAVTAACLADIPKAAIVEGVTTFPGVVHRLEHICTWRGIDFINDSKATNYDAAEVGLRSVHSPTILIAGGDPKAGDDTAWIQQIHQKAAAVLLIGKAAPQFAERLHQSGYPHTEIVETLENAVSRSADLAPTQAAKVVLLSPACASYDQYPNFEARGDHFRRLCQLYLQA
ncbi:UDP-N-acetylmuramoyl-L-alanine--D-glutamate ligase [Romeria aff. gracilis LEGE 07310]|uniref:UDP-N-acetylmuramoylalanine--D-glutamate ligase n=1 Tax=Vasconcelosia minhoensis LEGE 07310 TaxID=915328 RepID=A0A8J7AHS7_9CYAN|nr:UDP-N-acetylmuramoyl-L-alanine--D-glutamate ligase [Romeria gracilis]MBE9079361.1 UDP-N-acetylmuramoyl-L-alanine--D-glutamate ligase [Romeria aff. gracilis LEGE 07310]